jgi:YtkA-like
VLSKRNLLIALVWLALAQGCMQRNEPSSNLTLAYEVSPLPARVGPTTITLKLTDASGNAVTGARITLEGNMSHPGMPPVFADAREIEPGRYESEIDLSMAGDWYVLAHVSLPDGRKLDQQFEIKGVKAA